MSIDKIWKEKFRILSFQMDPKCRAHLTTICNFLQEGAGAHAESAGFGFEDMMRRNQVWVLSRLKVVIENYPLWNDEVVLKTWSRGKEGIFYLRDFQIENEPENTIIKATSSWAAINTKTRRPEIVVGLEDGLQSERENKVFEHSLNKLPVLSNPVFKRNRKIEYSDIDLVYHVNNVKYIEIILNSFPQEIFSKQQIKSLEINYLGEAKYGEVVSISNERTDENTYLVSVNLEKSKKEICRARLIWEGPSSNNLSSTVEN